MLEIKKGVYSIGVKDPKLRIFDVIMKTPRGTSYNSYLIMGSEKIAVIDTVKKGFEQEFISNIKEIVDPGKIDYVIVNHTESDHSGALSKLLELAPNAKVYASKNAKPFLPEILHKDVNPVLVGDGDKLSLGDKTLEFISTPFLHWPDTMTTYLRESKILFPCDYLSCHYSDDTMFDDEALDFSYAYKYYFDSIMRPFKQYSINALNKIEKLDIDIIAPSHGLILRSDPKKYLDLYRKWSTVPKKDYKSALVVYASSYGGTEKMAETIAHTLHKSNIHTTLMDFTGVDISALVDMIENTDALIVGSATIQADALKFVWDLLASLTTIDVRGKIGAAFGTYAWSGEAAKMIEDRLRALKFNVPEPFVRAKMIPTDEEQKSVKEFAERLATHILK